MESLNINSKKVLNNGVEMPVIGLGVFRAKEGAEVINEIRWAIDAGYRAIDTAKIYGNEEGVGKAIRDSGINREDIFVTTKLWNTDQGYESTLKAIDESLEKLGMDYVDLYLVHWPTASGNVMNYEKIDKREETWKAMEEIYNSGKARAIGVSNYMINHLEEMKNYASVMPAVNQFELHPFLFNKELVKYCEENNIAVESHTTFANGEKLNDERIKKIAEAHGKSPAQILVRWNLQHGWIVIPKSVHQDRIKENINVFNFELSADDMNVLDNFNETIRFRSDPTNL